MPTPLEIQAETWWAREIQPPALAVLCERFRKHYGLGPIYIGSKGDTNHLRGYHRSAAWIHHSAYCTNRTYSVTETPGNRNPGDEDWLCAIDMTIPRAELIAACQRLDVAVRAGKLEKITEWYGNDDGDNRVDGYNNIANRVATSDDSHLWHLHMSFDRGRANENHDDLYRIITGTTTTAAKEQDVSRYIFDGSYPDRPVELGSRVVCTDRLGVYSVEPFSAPAGSLAAPTVLTKGGNAPAAWSFAQVFDAVTGGCVWSGLEGVAAWRQPAAAPDTGGDHAHSTPAGVTGGMVAAPADV